MSSHTWISNEWQQHSRELLVSSGPERASVQEFLAVALLRILKIKHWSPRSGMCLCRSQKRAGRCSQRFIWDLIKDYTSEYSFQFFHLNSIKYKWQSWRSKYSHPGAAKLNNSVSFWTEKSFPPGHIFQSIKCSVSSALLLQPAAFCFWNWRMMVCLSCNWRKIPVPLRRKHTPLQAYKLWYS